MNKKLLALTVLSLVLISSGASAAIGTYDTLLNNATGGFTSNNTWSFNDCAQSTPGTCSAGFWNFAATLGDGSGASGNGFWQGSASGGSWWAQADFTVTQPKLIVCANVTSIFDLSVDANREWANGIEIYVSNDSFATTNVTAYINTSNFGFNGGSNNRTLNFSNSTNPTAFYCGQQFRFVIPKTGSANAPAISEFSLSGYNYSDVTITTPANISYTNLTDLVGGVMTTSYQTRLAGYNAGTCTTYLNGVQFNSTLVPTLVNQGDSLTGFTAGLNSYNVSCANSTASNSKIVYFTVNSAFGVNITVSNAANGTILNGWNVTSSNGTFSNSTGTQNSPYFWLSTFSGTNNSNTLWLNTSYKNYAQGNFSTNVTNNSIVQANLTIWPNQYFYVNDASTGKSVSAFTISLTNGGSTTTCTTPLGNCTFSLQNIVQGSNAVSVTANGYATTNFTLSITANSMINQTYSLPQANLTLSAFDGLTNASLVFNVSISNGTSTLNIVNATNGGVNSTFTASQVPTGTLTLQFNNYTGGYPQATYVVVFNNNTQTSVVAYLFPNSIASTVQFKVVNIQGAPIAGALVSVGGPQNGNSFPTVGNILTGSDGVSTFFLRPGFNYQVNASFQGVTNNNGVVQPAANSIFTITLNTVTNTTQNTIFNVTTFALTPSRQLYLQNETITWVINGTPYGLIQYYSLQLLWNGTQVFFQNNTIGPNGGAIVAYVNATSDSPYNFSAIPYLNATATIQVSGFTFFTYQTVFIINRFTSTGPYNIVTAFQGLSQQVCPNGLNGNQCQVPLEILAYILTLFIAGWVTSISSSTSGGVAALIFLGFFTYVQWIPINLWLIAFIAAMLVLGFAKGVPR